MSDNLMSNIMTNVQWITDVSFFNQSRIDQISENEISYGFASADAAEDDEVWIVMKQTTSGNITKKVFADSKASFTKKWSDRTTYTYA